MTEKRKKVVVILEGGKISRHYEIGFWWVPPKKIALEFSCGGVILSVIAEEKKTGSEIEKLVC